MSSPDDKSKRSAELRRRAEELLAKRQRPLPPDCPPDFQKWSHELQTYQIELELQNEELRRTQEELVTSRDRYADLYDFAPVSYITLSDKGMILEANLTAAQALGVERRLLIYSALAAFIVKEDRAIFYSHLNEFVKTGNWQAFEIRLQKKAGERFWVKVDAILDAAAGKAETRFRCTLTDITALKRAEGALQQEQADLKVAHEQLLHVEKLAAIGRLSGSIAHEFNNPIFGIRNVLVGIKRRASLADEDVELVDLALNECDKVKDLIRDLQDFNRPSSEVVTLIDIHKIINGIVLFFSGDFRNKKIQVERHFAADLPVILAVADQIKQVLLNLLSNAAEAMAASGGTITITTKVLKKMIAIHIRDTGVGIEPENRERIFEPFFTTKPSVKATGLGLSVSYGIIKRHEGKIEVESVPGHGSTFTILLPIEGPLG